MYFQTVIHGLNPGFHRLLNEFYKISDLPLLLYAIPIFKGEIIKTCDDMIEYVLSTMLDEIVIEDISIIKKQKHDEKLKYIKWGMDVLTIDIYDKELTYYKEYDSFCVQNCIRQILEYYGIDNAAFFINSSLSLHVKKSPEYKYGYKVSFDKDTRTVLPGFTVNINEYRGVLSDKNNIEKNWNTNVERVKSGIPIITGVDPYYLKYTTSYKKVHAFHSLIFCGCPKDNKKVTVVDWYEPWFFKGFVEMEDFLEARASENPQGEYVYSGYPIDYYWVEISRDGWYGRIDELLLITLDTTLNQYYTSNDSSLSCYTGISALKELINILERNSNSDSEFIQAFLRDLYIQLISVSKRLKLFILYINLSSKELGLPIIKSISDVIKDESILWDSLMICILKNSIIKTEVSYSKLINILTKIIEAEEKLYYDITSLRNILSKEGI